MSRIARPAANRGSPVDDDGDDAADQPVRVYSNASETGVTKPAGVSASAFDAGRIARQQASGDKPKRPRTVALPLDVDSIVIELDVPLPSKVNARAALAESCRQLLQKMPLGSSVVLPQASAKALIGAAAKVGAGISRQVQPDGTWRVWRVQASPRKRSAASASSGGGGQSGAVDRSARPSARLPAALSPDQGATGASA